MRKGRDFIATCPSPSWVFRYWNLFRPIPRKLADGHGIGMEGCMGVFTLIIHGQFVYHTWLRDRTKKFRGKCELFYLYKNNFFSIMATTLEISKAL
jgi:hypothetical protein